MSFYQGTTPTIEFITDTNLTGYELIVTIKQYSYNSLNLDGNRVSTSLIEVDGETVSKINIKLTQEETLAFEKCVEISMQIKAYKDSGNVMASNVMITSIDKILDKRMVGENNE